MSARRPRTYDEARRYYLRARAYRDFPKARHYIDWMRRLQYINPEAQVRGRRAQRRGAMRENRTYLSLRTCGLDVRKMSESRRGNMGDLRVHTPLYQFIIQVRDRERANPKRALADAIDAVRKAGTGIPVAYVLRDGYAAQAWFRERDFDVVMRDVWAMGVDDRFTNGSVNYESNRHWRVWKAMCDEAMQRSVPEWRPPALTVRNLLTTNEHATVTWWETFEECMRYLNSGIYGDDSA